MTTNVNLPGVELRGPVLPGYEEILTPEALDFIVGLQRKFDGERRRLLARRIEVQARIDAGEKPGFLAETAAIRNGDWAVAPLPADILDRRTEITGPVDRKMIINALNSGASVFMADFEDSTTPSWKNLIDGQLNLRDAIRGTIDFTDPATAKAYKLNDKTAVLFVRARGWHLPEAHVLVDGAVMSGSLFDFGLYFFHNAKALLAKGTGPYFYLPKMESHLEARLWNDVFLHAQAALGLPAGTIKATVLIETILAAFEMTTHFLRSYSQLVIRTCHRRNVHAMGGMAAQIPIKNDPAANDAAMAKVRADKEREAGDGHDGTWVAHPGLVAIAKEVFDRVMPGANQIARKRDDVVVGAADLIQIPTGTKTEAGLRQNIAVGIGYIEAWLRGIGCVPLFHLMEDAATAEISRAQVWQWRRHGATLDDGRLVDSPLIRAVLDDEIGKLRSDLDAAAWARLRYDAAAALFLDLVESDNFEEFLTLPAYRMVADAD